MKKTQEKLNEVESKLATAVEGLFENVKGISKLMREKAKLRLINSIGCDYDCKNCSSDIKERLHSKKGDNSREEVVIMLKETAQTLAYDDMMEAVIDFRSSVNITVEDIEKQLKEEKQDPKEVVDKMMQELMFRKIKNDVGSMTAIPIDGDPVLGAILKDILTSRK